VAIFTNAKRVTFHFLLEAAMQNDGWKAQADNAKLKMSSSARTRMRQRETAQYRYYDDGGPGRGNCTWGIGTLAHLGPCTVEELARPVSPERVEITFSEKVAEAERVVRKRVSSQVLSQDQFDALVSFTFNAGQRGAESVLAKVDKGDFKGAAHGISRTIYMSVRTKKGSKRVVARGLISRRAEESAPFRAVDK